MTKLFHYAAGPAEKFENGLIPRSRVIGSERRELEDGFPWIRNDVSFCFLDSAVPGEWIANFDGKYWEQIRTHTGDLLLSFDAQESDDIYVVDFGHIAQSQSPQNLRLYFQSRIPLSEYQGGYELPECVVLNAITRNRLSITGDPNVGPKYKKIMSEQEILI